jgi:precorrin-2 dehydrogenase/sirohydrochlorin ferrochelatase
MASLFPLFLKLESRGCLVVGAGRIASEKIPSLLAASAAVRVIAPKASDYVRKLAAEARVTWEHRRFAESDLDGITLVIAATGDPFVNQQIYDAAEKRRVLCNAVDEPERCHFFYPAVVRRGALQIAISTEGKSPALAQRLRKELETAFDGTYALWLDELGSTRKALFNQDLDPQQRTRELHRLASREAHAQFASELGNEQGRR